MLGTIPADGIAYALCEICDISEISPIPRGSKVYIQDFDPCGSDSGLFVVEYLDRIYLAEPNELSRIPRSQIRLRPSHR